MDIQSHDLTAEAAIVVEAPVVHVVVAEIEVSVISVTVRN